MIKGIEGMRFILSFSEWLPGFSTIVLVLVLFTPFLNSAISWSGRVGCGGGVAFECCRVGSPPLNILKIVTEITYSRRLLNNENRGRLLWLSSQTETITETPPTTTSGGFPRQRPVSPGTDNFFIFCYFYFLVLALEVTEL